MISMRLDTREFDRALKQYAANSKRDAVEIVNKIGRDLAYRAASFTPKASGAKIRAELMANKTPDSGGRPGRLVYLIINSRRGKTGLRGLIGEEMGAWARKTIESRIRGIGYLRAGWAQAVQAFGGTFRGARPMKGNLGGATIARPGTSPAAIIFSQVPGSGRLEWEALQRAITFKAQDMMKYVTRKLNQRAREISK